MKPKLCRKPKLCCTVQDVMSWQPCNPYTRKYVKKLFGRKKYLTALDILRLKGPDGRLIPVEDMFWVVLRIELIGLEICQEFANYCADWAVKRCALKCGVPGVKEWAARWLSGEDRSVAEATATRVMTRAATRVEAVEAAEAAVEAAEAAAEAAAAAEWTMRATMRATRATAAVAEAAEWAMRAAEVRWGALTRANRALRKKLIELLIAPSQALTGGK